MHKKSCGLIYLYKQFSITRETKLQTFQYKLLYMTHLCQKKLFDMKLVDNAMCLYCQQTDHITHFFLFCPKEKHFWNIFHLVE